MKSNIKLAYSTALAIVFTLAFTLLGSVFFASTSVAYEIPINDSICYTSGVASLEKWFVQNGKNYKAVRADKRVDYIFVSEDKNLPTLELLGIDVVLKPYYTERIIYTHFGTVKPTVYTAQLKASNEGECSLMQITEKKLE